MLLGGTVAAALAAILILSGHGGRPSAIEDRGHLAGEPAQGLWIVDTGTARVVHTIALPAGVYGSSEGGGFAWVADREGVSQLDQMTGRVLRTFPVMGGALAVVYAGGYLWVTPRTQSTPTTNAVVAIDLQSGVSQVIVVPGSYDTIFAGDGYAWVPGKRHIDRLDPATGKINGEIPFGLSQPNLFCAMAFTPHAVWIASAARGRLVRVDPNTLRIVGHARIRDTPEDDYCVTAGAGKIWVGADQGYGIYSFDPHTLRPTPVTLPVFHMSWMAGSRDALWFTTAKDPATLQAVTDAGKPVAKVQLPFAPLGFNVTGKLLYAGFARQA